MAGQGRADRAIVAIPVPLAHFPNVSIHLSLQYNYLMQFDYLPKSSLESGNLLSDVKLTQAIENLQVRAIPIPIPQHCTPVPRIHYAQFHN